MATIDSLANETLIHVMEMLKEPSPGWDSLHYPPPGRYDALRAAALVCSRWRDTAQRALFDEVELNYRSYIRPQQLLASHGLRRHRTKSLCVSRLSWFDALGVAEVLDGLQDVYINPFTAIRWQDLARPCFKGLTNLILKSNELFGEPPCVGNSLPAALSSLALWTNLDNGAATFLAAISRSSKYSLTRIHLRIKSSRGRVSLGPVLSDIGPHLQTLIVDADAHVILEGLLAAFPILQTLRSFSWHGYYSKHRHPLDASDIANLRTILDAFPSPATLTHLSIGTGSFSSLKDIVALLGHPTLALLSKIDFPSLPRPTPLGLTSAVAATTKACEARGIHLSMGDLGGGF